MSIKKAVVDLEFKSYVSGYEESKRKIDDLINSANRSKSTSGGGTSTSTAIVPVSTTTVPGDYPMIPQRYMTAIGGLLKTIALWFGIKALKNMLKTVKEIVHQSQVYQAIVTSIFQPFILMVNLMLLPVLKWLIPKVTEWLTWVTENKAAFDFIGKALVSIFESISQIVGVINPFDEIIEAINDIVLLVSDDGATTMDKVKGIAGALFDAVVEIATIPDRLGQLVLDALYTIGTNTPVIRDIIWFFEDLIGNMWNTIESAIEPIVREIPLVGDTIADALFGEENAVRASTGTPYVGEEFKPTISAAVGGTTKGTSDPYLVIMGDFTADDIVRPNAPTSAMLKAKVSYL